MQAVEYRVNTQCQTPPRLLDLPLQLESTANSQALLLEPLELEALAFTLDASLRVYARHHFFNWAQGLLQNLVQHELLICVLHNSVPVSFHVDSFAAPPVEPNVFTDMFHRDTLIAQQLMKAWEDNRLLPVVCSTESGTAFAEGVLAQELARAGMTTVLAHGTYDAFGKLVSFFIFARRSRVISPRQLYFLELIVPILHSAWVRSQINRPGEDVSANVVAPLRLTEREREILKWVYQGKTNSEIGQILGISTLTVKNHVQKILRKLNVQNRAQAVGKALAQRILNL